MVCCDSEALAAITPPFGGECGRVVRGHAPPPGMAEIRLIFHSYLSMIKIKTGKFALRFDCGIVADASHCLRVIAISERYTFSVNFYVRSPFFTRLTPSDSDKSRGVSVFFPAVKCILRPSGSTEIASRII